MNTIRTVKGFTLVEMIVVIAIIGVLAAIMVPTFSGFIERANNATDLHNIHGMINSINDAYAFDEDSGFYDNCWGTGENTNLGYIYVDNDEIRVSNLAIAKRLQQMGYIRDAEHPDRLRSGKEPCYNFKSKSKIKCYSSVKWCRFQVEFRYDPDDDALKWGITCATKDSSTYTSSEDACDRKATKEMAERVGVEPYYKDLGGLN